MKKILFLALIVILVGIVITLLLGDSPSEEPGFGDFPTYENNGTNGTNRPGETTGEESQPAFVQLDQPVYQASSMNTVLKTGQEIAVDNIKSAETVDPNNRQIFRFAADQADPDRSYDLIYFDEYDAFEIRLLQTPLDMARSQAELELMDTLGIEAQELCDLQVYVRTDIAPYNGDELGVSFCSQAVEL